MLAKLQRKSTEKKKKENILSKYEAVDNNFKIYGKLIKSRNYQNYFSEELGKIIDLKDDFE